MATKNPAVLWTVQQSLQNEDKARARSNIGAASASDLPSYTSSDADKSLCVNYDGNATEWARRLRGRFVEDDGQGGTNSYDVRTLTVNMNDSSKGLVRMWPEGKTAQICGWLVPDFHAYTDGGKVLGLDADANYLVWTTPPTVPSISLVHHSEEVSISGGQYTDPITYNLNYYIPAGKCFSGSITIQNLANLDHTSSAYHFKLYVPNNEMTCNFGDYTSARQSGHNIATTVNNTNGQSQYRLYFKLSGTFDQQTVTVNVNGITF